MTRDPGERATARGFTLVEIITVVAIVGVLMGLLLPALSAVRSAGRKTTEQSAARQLMAAYTMYCNSSRDRVMPGYKTGLKAVDPVGRSIAQQTTPVVAARYPWRIAPFLDYQFRGLYTNEQEWELQEMEGIERETYLYVVSLYPALGLNATWVGGHQNELGFNPVALEAYGRFWVESPTEVRRTDELIVFASARADALDYQSGESAGITQGYFEVRSPYLTASGGDRYVDRYDDNIDPGTYGFLSMRYDAQAVVAFMDNHIGTLGADDCRDMRRWARDADAPDWGLVPGE